ncbi:hypothetical protein G4B88_008516 [Cannabis sativa]|uniref:Uncharacterized protein n=1 Tax=Cannabis sativa TaxID=3483 RepID=A0A7J6EER8_CANSA|nr:hypothetical protein G4B88_008516 [Cannabis sativa]
MDWIHSFFNIALPPIIIFLHFLILPIYIPFKFPQSIKTSITPQENVARKRLAYEYGGRGAFLALIDIKDNFEVRRRALKLGSPDVISIVADVTRVEDCKKFIDEAVHHFGQCN